MFTETKIKEKEVNQILNGLETMDDCRKSKVIDFYERLSTEVDFIKECRNYLCKNF